MRTLHCFCCQCGEDSCLAKKTIYCQIRFPHLLPFLATHPEFLVPESLGQSALGDPPALICGLAAPEPTTAVVPPTFGPVLHVAPPFVPIPQISPPIVPPFVAWSPQPFIPQTHAAPAAPVAPKKACVITTPPHQDDKPTEDTFSTYHQTHSRPSQAKFRNDLIAMYSGQCFVTGTTMAVQATHIVPLPEDQAPLLDNGILLCADFHYLFDQHQWSLVLDPDLGVYKVYLGDHMLQDPRYRDFHGKTFGNHNAPQLLTELNYENIRSHYAKFKLLQSPP